ncbi:MAG: MBL fold metallo-hydrolase [Deltaproteobacteria bacterium]|nr:MBL fold metallo-hydrolase [Deltaproteobacteria bacterium]
MLKKFKIKSADSQTIDTAIASVINDIRKNSTFRDNFNYLKEKKEKIEVFIKEGKSQICTPKNQLIILRKWNSYTPILPPSREEYLNKGGGYFLRIGEIGIVLDPGYNFIENYLNAGFKLDDIDHIFISHAHNDHSVELEGIFSLLFKRNKISKKPKKIKIYMNLGTFKKYSGYFDLSNPPAEGYIDDIILLNKHQMFNVTDTIQVFTTQTKHHEMITKKYALGFTFVINNVDGTKKTVKFTCDTGWCSSLEELNKAEGEKFNIERTDLLIAHIGSIKESELNYNTKKSLMDNEDKGILYEYHLGLVGCAASIHFWQPELSLLSEFGEELDAIRKTISDYLRKTLKTKVFPTDLNFRIDLDTLDIMCFKTRHFFPAGDIKLEHFKGQLYPYNESKLSGIEKKELSSHLGRTIKVF